MKTKMINGQAPTPSFTGIKSIPYPRRPSRSRHDIEFVLAISNSAHEVGFGDSLASRLTLAEGREKFDEIYLRECVVEGGVRRDIVGGKIHMNIKEMEEQGFLA